jgi:copper resistance protein D
MLTEVAIETAALRALVYAGTIAAAGACLFATTFPTTARSMAAVLRWQILIGALLILCVEPIRLVLFQLAISGGDAELAFAPDMRWMAFQMPNGQAAAARVAGVLLIAAFGLRVPLLGLLGCGLAIGSYALEGHTAATAQSGWASMTLLIHLAVAHWWLGALWPLAACLRALSTDGAAATIERFGQLAAVYVPFLLMAGGILFAVLVSWRLQLSDPYQVLVAIKVLVVAALLALAAVNKFVLTPRLRTDPPRGANALRRSIALEVVLACFVLVLTGAITSTSPGGGH